MSCGPVAWGVGVVFLSFVSRPSALDFLESLVPLGHVAPRLLMHLSPGNDMIPDEGIMACPGG
jgi:hypothetical protein